MFDHLLRVGNALLLYWYDIHEVDMCTRQKVTEVSEAALGFRWAAFYLPNGRNSE